METSQLAEIRSYLLSKNLPIDILMEVEDHFVAQITNLQAEGFNFAEAFGRAKTSWKPALEFPKFKVQYDLNDSTYFLRKISEEESKSIAKQSIVAAVFGLLVLLISVYMLPLEMFQYAFLGIIILSVSIPILHYNSHLQNFRLAKKYSNYKLTIHQNASVLSVALLGCYMPFVMNFSRQAKVVYNVLHGDLHDWMLDSLPIIYLFLFWLNAYCFISQRKYLKQIEKVKPYLKNLTPSK